MTYHIIPTIFFLKKNDGKNKKKFSERKNFHRVEKSTAGTKKTSIWISI